MSAKPPQTEIGAGLKGLTLEDIADETLHVQSNLKTPHPTKYPNQPNAPAIYATTSWNLQSADQILQCFIGNGFVYTRYDNPTVQSVESVVNEMERGSGTVAFGSGQAAIFSALTTFLKAGDHIVATWPMYIGSHNIIVNILSRFNIESTFVGFDLNEFKNAVKPNTRVFFAQTPTEFFYMDLEGLAKLANSIGNIITMVDNSCSTPYLLKPIPLGIDLSIQSATKGMGGHSDLIAGLVTAKTAQQYNQLLFMKRIGGAILSPFDAFLLHRGIQTLHLRIDRMCENAEKVVAYLNVHPQVEHVYYPGLPNFHGHEAAKREMKKFGYRVNFVVKGGLKAADAFMENLRLFTITITYGSVHSVAEHPVKMALANHRMSEELRKTAMIEDGTIRLGIGIENCDDIIKELKYVLEKATEASSSSAAATAAAAAAAAAEN